MSSPNAHPSQTTLYRCGAVRDAAGNSARPGAIAVRDGRILQCGDLASIEQSITADELIDLPDTLVLPAMVNVHAHLDLHAIGRVPCNGSFVDWVANYVMPWRAKADDAALKQSVLDGLSASRQAGAGAIGDIAASVAAIEARCGAKGDQALPGISWVECVGLGDTVGAVEAALQREKDVAAMLVSRGFNVGSTGVHIDRQPHAPYSADPSLYRSDRMRCGSTHLAETLDEASFVLNGSGAITDFRKAIGRWDESIRGWGKTPAQHFCDVAQPVPWIVAHCNYVSDDDIAALNRFASDITIAYCPIASEYFGHRDHRYRDMLKAGLNVALGTDSILCQPMDESQPMGILPQMRRLFHRDRTDAEFLLRMATINAASALAASRDNWHATLNTTEPARLIGVKFDVNDATDPLEQVLSNTEPVSSICFHV